MDRSSSQGMVPGLHRGSVTPGSMQPEYWNNLDSLYPGPDPPHQHPHPSQQQMHQSHQQQQQHRQQQQQPQQQTQSMGIGWDHPIFSQQHQQRAQVQSHQEHDHGIYSSSTPQSWQQNSLQQHHRQQQQILSPAPQGLGVPTQYHQVHRYPPGQVTFDSRPLPATDNPPYQSYSYPQNFYSSQHMSLPDAFPQSNSPQASRSQTSQQNLYQSVAHQTPLASYSLPAGYSDGNSMNFITNYTEPATNVTDDPTINPQMLNPAQQSSNQHSALQNPFLYVNSANYGRPDDGKLFNFFENDLQVPSVMGQSTSNHRPIPGQNAFEGTFQVNGQTSVDSTLQAKPIEPPKKKARTKTVSKKTTTVAKRSSASESDTSDDSELEIQFPEEPSPIPATRPTDPEAAVEYDTLQAVWSPRNRRPNADKVKNALVAFKDVVKRVRDAWKESSQAMKMAENKDDNDKAAQLKKDVVLQRRLMDVVVSTTLEKGHPAIVEKLGEHPMALAAMYSFLLDRHQASDVDGAFTVNILKLLARFGSVDEEVLQKTNIAKLLPRFVKKGGPTVKELSQKILDNAAVSTKKKQETTKAAGREGSATKSSASEPASANNSRPEIAGSKRPREGETNGQGAPKRMVVTSNIKPVAKASNATTNGPVKRPQEAAQENKSAAAVSRPKANIIAPKPTSLFGSLISASKRPGTSNAERAAAAAAAKTSPPAEKKETQTAPPKPTFSFGDIMADLNKQKETESVEPTEDRPPESEEERQKRLRKEARRKLRVTWKPDDSLTEIRLFTHDPDEELTPGDRSQGEIGDIKGEGSALKLHRDLDDLEDDDDGVIREENLMDYSEPSEIDKGDMASDDRSRNYIKRGGTQEPSSPEKQAQEHREATTLMVFYTSAADIPPSPKEPPQADVEGPVTEVTSFGELPDHIKVRQERYYSLVNPKPAPVAAAPPIAQNNQFDISNLLKIIQNASQQQSTPPPPPPPPPPQPASQAPMSDLERTISMFRQQQPQVPQIPQFPSVSQAPATQGIDFQKLLAVMSAQNQMPPAPIVPQVQPSQPAMAPNLAAIISQFANQNQQAGSSQPSGQHYEEPERKRMRELDGSEESGDDRFGYTKRRAPNMKHRGETPTFTAHVQAGLRALADDPNGLLVFSGGPTKKDRTDIAEGTSYHNLAKDNDYFSYASRIDPDRIIAETNATDSYQNVLFSLLRFRSYVGAYPKRITVVTHEFKRQSGGEVEDSCSAAVVGINPPEEVTPLASLISGEEKSGIGLWRRDPYGVGEELAAKRVKRGWKSGMEDELFVDMELEAVVEELLRWHGGMNGDELFPRLDQLPWY
ncbi:hypothetical protein CNMCM5793_006100 [Aspergillus hiratsukae]|uniref:DUF218 domain-containing protein n=1 Tax=Aspergillus hiratsukae TaxID=1194566 RepID=A0A8H6UD20_9EURO|nr:hypothetical protein CNMCM5793_006100 [Aspergillus hiratsukae]KAF7158883.1 hypothetical protein CNMCM6106_005841 [Aspergillus hiratsukae]